MERINHLAVIVAAVVYFLLGWLWYTVFRSAWMAYNGLTANTVSPMILVATFVIGLVIAYVIAMALSRSPNPTAMGGVQFGLISGIGFVALSMLMGFINEGRPLGLWAIDAGYIVVGFVIMGAIIAGWRKSTRA